MPTILSKFQREEFFRLLNFKDTCEQYAFIGTARPEEMEEIEQNFLEECDSMYCRLAGCYLTVEQKKQLLEHLKT